MRPCAACGSEKGGMALGGTILCRQCAPAVEMEIEALRAQNKPVNVAHIAHRMYKESHPSGGYLLRDIPEDLWTEVKHRAVDDKTSLRDLILTALRQYLKK